MHAEVRQGRDVLLYEPAALEDEVRAGRVRPDGEVRFLPWTGDAFVRIDRVPALAAAVEAPDARLAAALRAPPVPWATLAVLLLVGVAALGQGFVGALRDGGVGLPAAVVAAVAAGDLGYASAVLDGRWWTPWTGPLLHAGVLHLLGNLPILAYSGWRVERALGAGAHVLVGALGLALAALAIPLLGADQVVGSSILAFAYWGAQIAVGLRFGDRLPAGSRGAYGWGNLVLFIPLFVPTLGDDGISHLGHVAGLVGGILAAFVVPPDTLAPAVAREARRRRTLAVAAGTAVAPALLLGGLAQVPALAGAPWRVVTRAEDGLTVPLPARLAPHEVRLGGLHGWAMPAERDAWVYADRMELGDAALDPTEAVRRWWERRTGAPVVALDAPAPRADGWSAVALRVDGPGGASRVEEQLLRRGRTVWRVGWQAPERKADGPRARLYRSVVAGVEVGDPEALVRARAAWTAAPEIPERAWRYAEGLVTVGAHDEADRVLAGLDGRTDGWQWDAARARMALWAEAPRLAERADPAWVERWVDAAPAADVAVLDPGLAWLAARGACATVRRVAERVARDGGLDALPTDDPAVVGCLAQPAPLR